MTKRNVNINVNLFIQQIGMKEVMLKSGERVEHVCATYNSKNLDMMSE